ncbi:hypothetical protein CMI37_12160 [Candidatus Pacearchaeota archaeon]|nr:hypothetical protein [Candidatus Pacearchaeota archaeon]|tara:strand:+ start:11748 stop:12119 length:372 start_codon:yes stop_codon:yes gene_type:complete
MAGTLTYEDNKPNSKAAIGSVVISWTGTAGGAVSGNSVPFNGRIERVVTNPTDGPTANYDITLDDADGLDLAQGLLANRHTTNSEEVTPLIGTYHLVPYRGLITPTVANSGSSKSGTITIYYS